MKEDDFPQEEVVHPGEGKSRTRIKQEMIELQKLGESLVDLPRAFLKKIGLPADLLEAVLYAKEVRTHGARRRQKQHIGALMREVEDPAFIRAALDRYHQGITAQEQERPAAPQQDHTIDLLAEELVSAGEDRIEAMASRYPSLHPDRLWRLIRHVREESAGSNSRMKADKALKQYLEKIVSQHT
jgi:ribosome-associated protein